MLFTIIAKKSMECGHVCEVLHNLLEKIHGTSFVELSTILADVDNMAALDLLCALFKHSECHKICGAHWCG